MANIAKVKFDIFYGGKKSGKRTVNIPVRIEGSFDGIDYKGMLTAGAVALKPFLVDQATVGRASITLVKEQDSIPLPDNPFQSIKTNEVGVKVQGNVKDAALKEVVGVFEGAVARGRSPQYHLPYFLIEDDLVSDKALDPEALNVTVNTVNTQLAAFYAAIKAIGVPCVFGTTKNGKNRRTGSRDVEKFTYAGVMNKSLPSAHKSAAAKKIDAVKAQLSEINSVVRRETDRVAGTTEKFDPELLTQVKTDFTKLLADFSPAAVRRAGVPYPLNTLVAVPK